MVLAASLSCGQRDANETVGEAPAAASEHDARASRDHAGEIEGEAGEASDLDRPVEELAAAVCEHGRRTFECDECRYEVGFVRAPSAVTDGGLIATAKAERRRVAVPIALTGEVSFDERRVGHVNSQVEGVIKAVHVALGDRVTKGQPLVEVESVAVGEEEAAYHETEGVLAIARRNFDRVDGLRRENIASEKEYLEAKRELDAAEIREAAARAKLARLGADGSSGGRVTLRSPIAGTVLVLHAVPGEVAFTDEPLATVGDNGAVWVWADLYDRDIAAVKDAQGRHKLAASVSVKAYPRIEFQGTVDLVSPAMDEASRTVKARIHVENRDGRLLAGMFAAVDIFLPAEEEALAVPKHAVLEDEGRAFVFVHHHGDYFVRRPVVPGRSWGDWVEIVDGLEPSQTLVAEGAFLMKSDVLRSKMGAGCAD
jgi:cobalt-zinc-cadmium efflux system membrane fusion protein